jgi:hypothetical protein
MEILDINRRIEQERAIFKQGTPEISKAIVGQSGHIDGMITGLLCDATCLHDQACLGRKAA